MKRRKRRPRQLSLLEPRPRWSDLPDDIRQNVVDRLAQLLIQTLSSPSTTQESTHAFRKDSC